MAIVKTEVAHWRPFEHRGTVYDLSHLDAHEVEYQDSRHPDSLITYKFTITYGLHCFTQDAPHLSPSEQAALMYQGPRESRVFNLERYNLSINLPVIIQNLASKNTTVFHTEQRDTYATVKLLTPEGNAINYFVVFTAFRENKRFRLHVRSAYPKENLGKIKKVSFFSIAHNLLKNKPLPKPNQ
jgi:hypothetical protein